MSSPSIAENLARVQGRVGDAAKRAGRDPASISIIAVSKRVEETRIQAALALGVTELGESRVQETRARFELLRRASRLHLVGHLQTNKAGQAVEMYDLIHSIDSERLAAAVDRRAAAIGKRQDVLIEVNTTGEAAKHGVCATDLDALIELVSSLEHVELCGLMTIGPLDGGADGARRSFARLRRLFADLRSQRGPGLDVLSMGMSDDFEIAVEEGATHVRVGTAIFGPREVPAAQRGGSSEE